MPKYKKRSYEVEAFQFQGKESLKDAPEWVHYMMSKHRVRTNIAKGQWFVFDPVLRSAASYLGLSVHPDSIFRLLYECKD